MKDSTKENLAMWIADRLPRRVCKWVIVRVCNHATMCKYIYRNEKIDDIKWSDILERWDNQ